MTLNEVNEVSEVVASLADPTANVIFGAVIDDLLDGEINVTIIATGFEQRYDDLLKKEKVGRSTDQVRKMVMRPL